MADYSLEDASDDLLLLFEQAGSGSEPTADQLGGMIAARVDTDALVRFLATPIGKKQPIGAQKGFTLGTDGLGRIAATNVALAAKVLWWASQRTGMTPADIVRDVLDDAEKEG